MTVRMITATKEKCVIARNILSDLPEWFGIPESTEEYIRESGGMPFFAAIQDGEAIGFMALKETSPYTAEIYVCGVKKRLHRCGRAVLSRVFSQKFPTNTCFIALQQPQNTPTPASPSLMSQQQNRTNQARPKATLCLGPGFPYKAVKAVVPNYPKSTASQTPVLLFPLRRTPSLVCLVACKRNHGACPISGSRCYDRIVHSLFFD